MDDWNVIHYGKPRVNGKRVHSDHHLRKDFDGDGTKQDLFPTHKYTIPKLNYTKVGFTTSDNVPIKGYYAHGHHCAPVVVIVHGNSMCTGKWENMLPAAILWKHGFNVLAIDLRNHGMSGEVKMKGFKIVSWGAYEHLDVLAAVNWLKTDMGYPASRIGLFGSSMGGGTVTIAAGEDPTIRAVWADAPVCDLHPVFAKGFGVPLPSFMLNPLVDWAMKVMFNICDDPAFCEKYAKPGDSAKSFTADQSAYYVSTTGDNTVVAAVVEKCVESAKSSEAKAVTYWAVDDVKDYEVHKTLGLFDKYETDTHVQTMLYYTDRYKQRMLDFFNASSTLGTTAMDAACVAKHYPNVPAPATRRRLSIGVRGWDEEQQKEEELEEGFNDNAIVALPRGS